jgi:hypothetical protein
VGFPLPWALLCATLAATPPAPTSPPFPLVFSSAVDEAGRPLLTDDWLDAELDAAQTLFATFGVRFSHTRGPVLDAWLAHVESRADRDALAGRAQPQVVNVFVVGSLRDVDDPTQMRRGVHWHAPGRERTHYVIVVATAPPTVLAHELGHFFGNPHSHVVDNVMSYERSGAAVFFDAEQGRRIAARARDYLRSADLLLVDR